MANTRITQGVIKPNENYVTGVITATSANITGDLTVGGVVTYEDVTSIDSVGIITARKGIVSLGVVTATAFHGDGSQLTGIDATALKDTGGNVKIQAQASGAVHTGISSFGTINVGSGATIESNGQATFAGIVTFGSSSVTIDGDNSVAKVGTALTLGHTQGVQFHTQNLHAEGFEVNNINASGIITAAQFSGDGSNLANLPAGLGTALSSSQSSPLNKIYYTNTVLPVETTITVDTPESASAAYTQYADISVGSSADLIISDGDDLIPDVLGLRPDGFLGGGSVGRIRVDSLTNKNASGPITIERGLIISSGVTTIGIDTTKSFLVSEPNLTTSRLEATTDCVILYSAGTKVARTHNKRFEIGNPSANIGIAATFGITGNALFGGTGIVTATSFVGSGANLTSLPAGQLTGALPSLDGSALTGIVGGKFNGPAAGILTTSTVGIQTADVTSADLVGAATSMVGLYIGDGSLLFSKNLNRSGGYYITTGLNALNAGPVTLNSTLTLDGSWVIV